MTLFYLCRHRFFPAHLRRAQTPNRRPHSYRALQPYGLFRGRNGVPLIRSRVLAGTVWWVRRYIRKRNGFPNRLRMQMLTGWVVCRTWCINARRVVVRICFGRGCWQAVRSAGLGSTDRCGCVLSQAVRSAGKIESHTVFHDARTPTACANPESSSTFLPSPSALMGWFATGMVSHVIGRGCWQAVRSAGLGSTGVYGACCRRPSGLRARRNSFPRNLPLHKLHNLTRSIIR